MTAGIKRIAADLFTPLPEESSGSGRSHPLELTAKFVNQTSGAVDFYRIAKLFLGYIQRVPVLSAPSQERLNRLSNVVELSGSALSLPSLLSDINAVRNSVNHYRSVLSLPAENLLRGRKVLQAGKGVALDSIGLVGTVTDSLGFLDATKICDLGKSLAPIQATGVGAFFILDLANLVEEVYKLQSYQEVQATGNENKKKLSWMKIAQYTAGIALGILGALSLFCTVTLPIAVSVIAFAGLGLSTIYLAMKIGSFFYERAAVSS